MWLVQYPQHIFVAGYLEPERPVAKEINPSLDRPLMAAMQAAAIAQAQDHGLRLSGEDKLAQSGTLATFFARHQNGMMRRHELLQP